MAVWSGQVTLTDLKLRREACYALGLPFSIKAGYIEHVELSIPWNKLGSEPVVLTMDGVYLVAGPLDEGAAQEDEAAAGEWAWSRKRGRLQRLWQAAQLKSAGLQAEGSEAAGEGLAPALDVLRVEDGARVLPSAREGRCGESSAEVDNGQGVAHLASLVAPVAGVTVSKLAEFVAAPTFDLSARQQCASMLTIANVNGRLARAQLHCR